MAGPAASAIASAANDSLRTADGDEDTAEVLATALSVGLPSGEALPKVEGTYDNTVEARGGTCVAVEPPLEPANMALCEGMAVWLDVPAAVDELVPVALPAATEVLEPVRMALGDDVPVCVAESMAADELVPTALLGSPGLLEPTRVALGDDVAVCVDESVEADKLVPMALLLAMELLEPVRVLLSDDVAV